MMTSPVDSFFIHLDLFHWNIASINCCPRLTWRMVSEMHKRVFANVKQIKISPILLPEECSPGSPRTESPSSSSPENKKSPLDKKGRFNSLFRDAFQLSPRPRKVSNKVEVMLTKEEQEEDFLPRNWKPLHPLPDISLESPKALPDQKALQQCWRSLSYLPRPLAPIEETES